MDFMDHDPDFRYDDEEPECPLEEMYGDEVYTEYDDNFNPLYAEPEGNLDAIDLAAAVGFGYSMAEDEFIEKDIHKCIKEEQQKITKIPLSQRYFGSGGGKPFERWLVKVLAGQRKITDPLEYTEEELEAALKDELRSDIEL